MPEDEFKTPPDGAGANTDKGRTGNGGVDPAVVNNLVDDFNAVAKEAERSVPRRDPNEFEKLRLIIAANNEEAEMIAPLFGRLEEDIQSRNDNLSAPQKNYNDIILKGWSAMSTYIKHQVATNKVILDQLSNISRRWDGHEKSIRKEIREVKSVILIHLEVS